MEDKLVGRDFQGAFVERGAGQHDAAEAKGWFVAECFGPDGKLKWRDEFPNVVTTAGKNSMLDNFLAGSAFTQTGPFVGLISSVSFTGVATADTMTSHTGWTEAGNANAPTYTAPRKTVSWAAASAGAKAFASAHVFAITSSGTVKGAFIVLGTGAVNTIDNTGGILWSGGLFSSGDKLVGNGDTLNVSYTTSL